MILFEMVVPNSIQFKSNKIIMIFAKIAILFWPLFLFLWC